MRGFRREDSGQALVIAAIAAFVLAGALAFTIDWGYALVQRQITQNKADKIVLGVGRLIATSVRSANTSGATFGVSKQDACDEALLLRDRDGITTSRTVLGGDSLVLTFEEPGADETMDCITGSTTGGSSIDDDLTSVFVRIELRYRTLLASLLRQPMVTVGASARAALQGAPYCGSTADPYECGDNSAASRCASSISSCADVTRSATAIGHTWPIVRFYRPSELTNACGPLCDPTTVTPLLFSTASDLTSGVELLDLSRYSSREAPESVPQLMTNWDETGSVQASTSPKADRTGACGRDWDTAGGEDPFTENGTCSLGNWFDYPVGAALGLNTEWRNDALRAQLGTPNPERPPALTTSRQACSAAAVTPWLAAPSCGDADVGDWIETVQRSMGSDLVSRMRAFIAREGMATRFSNDVVPTGPNAGNQYGKAAVVWIYMWDCGQEFNGDEDGQWNAVNDQCLRRASRRRPIDLRPPDEPADRVHLFTVIPVTFYEGLITTDAIEGYVGGGFVNPGRCQTDRACLLNPLANSAFLVADDP